MSILQSPGPLASVAKVSKLPENTVSSDLMVHFSESTNYAVQVRSRRVDFCKGYSFRQESSSRLQWIFYIAFSKDLSEFNVHLEPSSSSEVHAAGSTMAFGPESKSYPPNRSKCPALRRMRSVSLTVEDIQVLIADSPTNPRVEEVQPHELRQSPLNRIGYTVEDYVARLLRSVRYIVEWFLVDGTQIDVLLCVPGVPRVVSCQIKKSVRPAPYLYACSLKPYVDGLVDLFLVVSLDACSLGLFWARHAGIVVAASKPGRGCPARSVFRSLTCTIREAAPLQESVGQCEEFFAHCIP